MPDVLINSSINQKFNDVFTEVEHGEKLNLRNPNALRMYYLAVENNLFSYDSLTDLLVDSIGYYVYSRARINQFNVENNIQSMGLRALRTMQANGAADEKGTGNELGEILIYAFLEHVMGAPKVMSKVELNSTGGDRTSKSDGIHLLSLGDEGTPYYQLVFGTSGIIDDMRDAVDIAFERIIEIEAGKDDERQQLISVVNLDNTYSDEVIEVMKGMILPGKTKYPMDMAYGIFIGYKLGLDPAKYSNVEFRHKLKQKMELDIQQHANYISQKIIDLGLQTHSFYVFVVPLNEALADKKKIMEMLMGA